MFSPRLHMRGHNGDVAAAAAAAAAATAAAVTAAAVTAAATQS